MKSPCLRKNTLYSASEESESHCLFVSFVHYRHDLGTQSPRSCVSCLVKWEKQEYFPRSIGVRMQ